jgi:hypothetical protein
MTFKKKLIFCFGIILQSDQIQKQPNFVFNGFLKLQNVARGCHALHQRVKPQVEACITFVVCVDVSTKIADMDER